jgi:DHA1 family bicyclomycin/chloramphenicol resistance-like MFS transporter
MKTFDYSAPVTETSPAAGVPSGPVPRRFVFLIAAMGSIGPFAIDTYLPALPAIGRDLAASPVAVQQTLSIYLLAFAAMTLWHGALSDALGRRRVLLVGFAVFALASVGAALAGSIEALWAWRALQGAVGGAGLAISRAVARDVAQGADAQRLMSQSTMVFALAPAIAPMIGGVLEAWFGWRAVFAFLALMASALFLAVWRWLPETLPPGRRQSLHPVALARGYASVFRQAAFWRLAGTLATLFQGFFLYVMAAPMFLMTHLGLAATQFHWLFVPFTVGTIGGAFTASRLAGRLSLDACVRLGQVLMALSVAVGLGLAYALPGRLPWAVLPLAVYTFGLAIAMSSLQVMLIDLAPQRRGMVSSCQGFVQSLANSLAAGLLVPLVWGTLAGLAWTSAALMTIGVALYALQRGMGRAAPS